MDAGPQAATATQSASASASASPAAAEAFAIFPCIIVMPLPSWPTEVGGLAMLYYLEWTLGKVMQHHHKGARTGPPTVLRAVRQTSALGRANMTFSTANDGLACR